MPPHPALALPGSSDIHLWRIALSADVARLVPSLSAAELVRLARCQGDRRPRFVTSHGAMRQVLARYLQCAPADVPLIAEYGHAPTVPGLSLSLAHCDDVALLAVSGTSVGVDIEPADAGVDDDLSELAEATLARAELERFHETPVWERPRSWVRLWVRKEAVLKARGEGLTDRTLCDLDVSEDGVDELTVADVDVGAGHVAAAASAARNPQIRMEEWIDESR
jgi:4'-phosphopantetheinyl transferase